MSFAVYESRALFRVLSHLHLSEIRKSAREGWVDSSRLKIRNFHEISERQKITVNVAWCGVVRNDIIEVFEAGRKI